MLNLQTSCFKITFTGFFILTLVSSSYSYDIGHSKDQISQSGNNEFPTLENLGTWINSIVQKELEPLNSGQLNHPTYSQMKNYQGSFSHLGEQIQQQVYEGLAPVRAMEMTLKMANGVGGTTISTHFPGGRKFVIKNYGMYQCNGHLSQSGKCNGELIPFQIHSKTDYCFVKNKVSQVNDWVCIGADSVLVINSNVKCRNSNNDPILVTKRDEYIKMCKNLSQTVEYKYLPNSADPSHVKIPNENKYVKCTNNEPNVCVFSWGSLFSSDGSEITVIDSN